MSANQLYLEMVLGALKVLASYGQVLLSFLFLFAAGLLFFAQNRFLRACFLAACSSQRLSLL